MTIDRCKRCNVQIIYQPHIGDFLHQCNSNILALDQEDVVHFHTSFTNSEGITTQQQGGFALQKGLVNKNLTVEPGAIREDVEDYTPRGNRQSTTRRRQHFEYITTK